VAIIPFRRRGRLNGRRGLRVLMRHARGIAAWAIGIIGIHNDVSDEGVASGYNIMAYS